MLKKHFQKKTKQALRIQEESDNDMLNYDDDVDDEQYLQMLQGNAPVKREVVLDSRYSGRKVSNHSDVVDEFYHEDEIEDIEDESIHEEVKQSRKKSIAEEEEDIEIAERKKQSQAELLATSAQIKEQLRIWQQLVDMRQQMQKSIEILKKLPLTDKFYKRLGNTQLTEQIRQQNNALLTLQQSLYGGEQSMENFKNPEIEQDIIKWSQKTAMLQNLKKGGFLLQTPLGQTQKAMQSKDKLIVKTQLKRSVYRILGEPASDLNNNHNKNIYDDTDFYLDLLKESLANDDQDKDTEQYILKRQSQRQEKEEKVVDRRASKCRKVRFEPHQKIVNFMVRIPEPTQVLPRDDILRNIFGEHQIIKKAKIDDIQLI